MFQEFYQEEYPSSPRVESRQQRESRCLEGELEVKLKKIKPAMETKCKNAVDREIKRETKGITKNIKVLNNKANVLDSF